MILIIEILIVVGFSLLEVAIVFGSGIIRAFMTRINIIDSLAMGVLGGMWLPIFARDWFGIDMHPVLYVAIGLVLFLLSYWILSTKIGFWIMSALFSAFWAVLPTIWVHYYVNDLIWTIATAAGIFILSMSFHFKSRAIQNASNNNNAQTS